jgi:hypothetical protein
MIVQALETCRGWTGDHPAMTGLLGVAAWVAVLLLSRLAWSTHPALSGIAFGFIAGRLRTAGRPWSGAGNWLDAHPIHLGLLAAILFGGILAGVEGLQP